MNLAGPWGPPECGICGDFHCFICEIVPSSNLLPSVKFEITKNKCGEPRVGSQCSPGIPRYPPRCQGPAGSLQARRAHLHVSAASVSRWCHPERLGNWAAEAGLGNDGGAETRLLPGHPGANPSNGLLRCHRGRGACVLTACSAHTRAFALLFRSRFKILAKYFGSAGRARIGC